MAISTRVTGPARRSLEAVARGEPGAVVTPHEAAVLLSWVESLREAARSAASARGGLQAALSRSQDALGRCKQEYSALRRELRGHAAPRP